MLLSGWQAYGAWRGEYERITDPARYPIGWLDTQVATGHILAWACPTAGMLVRVDSYPTGLKEAHCMAAAGDMAGIMDLRAIIEHWARAQGCAAAVVESRPGWARALKREGYEMHQVAIRKVL